LDKVRTQIRIPDDVMQGKKDAPYFTTLRALLTMASHVADTGAKAHKETDWDVYMEFRETELRIARAYSLIS
jgi:hypothetical protein